MLNEENMSWHTFIKEVVHLCCSVRSTQCTVPVLSLLWPYGAEWNVQTNLKWLQCLQWECAALLFRRLCLLFVEADYTNHTQIKSYLHITPPADPSFSICPSFKANCEIKIDLHNHSFIRGCKAFPAALCIYTCLSVVGVWKWKSISCLSLGLTGCSSLSFGFISCHISLLQWPFHMAASV